MRRNEAWSLLMFMLAQSEVEAMASLWTLSQRSSNEGEKGGQAVVVRVTICHSAFTCWWCNRWEADRWVIRIPFGYSCSIASCFASVRLRISVTALLKPRRMKTLSHFPSFSFSSSSLVLLAMCRKWWPYLKRNYILFFWDKCLGASTPHINSLWNVPSWISLGKLQTP